MQPEIRAAIREDFADIARLCSRYTTCTATEDRIFIKRRPIFTHSNNLQKIWRILELLFLVAVWEGKPVGMCQVKYHTLKDSGITKERTRAYVEALCVQENCQNHGIGKQLLQKAEEEGKRRKSLPWKLTAWEFNEEVLELL